MTSSIRGVIKNTLLSNTDNASVGLHAGEIPPDYIMNEGDMLVAMTEQAAGLLGCPILVPESDKFLHNQRLGLGA